MTTTYVLTGLPGVDLVAIGTQLSARTGLSIQGATESEATLAAAPSLTEGEGAYRVHEQDMALQALHEPGIILLPGGALETSLAVQHQVQELRAAGAWVVVLDLDFRESARRSGLNAARPVGLGPVNQMWCQLATARLVQLKAFADQCLDTTESKPGELVAQILAATPPQEN